MGSHNKPISQALEEVNNLCKSIFHIPAQNLVKHFFPYIARSLAVLSEQKEESAFVLLTMRLRSQRIRSTPNSEKIIRQPSLFQHYALIGAQRFGGVGVVTQQFLGIGPAYGQGLGNFPLPQVAENQQLRLAVVPAIG